MEVLDKLYDMQIEHKHNPNFYRELYSKDFSEVLNDEELNSLGISEEIKSYADLISPITEYIKTNNLDTPENRKQMMDYIPNLQEVLCAQKNELKDLTQICIQYGIQINQKDEIEGKNALDDCMEDDRLRISIEQTATRFVKTAVQGRDENNREEENNIGE